MTDAEKALFGIDKLNVARSEIPARDSCRLFCTYPDVHAETNPRFPQLLECFKAKTGCPVLVNTSFNVRENRSSAHRRRVPLFHG